MPKKSKPKPTKLQRLQIIVPPELGDACRESATARGETLGALIRRAMAAEIGRPALAEMRGRGKPSKKTD